MAELTMGELDCWSEREAVCPHCGYRNPDSWEYSEGDNETYCPSCGEDITVTVDIEVRYTTAPKGGWPDDDG